MHFIFRHTFQFATILLLTVALAACGAGEKRSRNNSANEQSTSSVQQVAVSTAETVVNVVARDFEFTLDTSTTAAGAITFVLSNEGSMPHDFAITINGERVKTEMIKPGASGSISVELSAGRYEYICTVPGHDILGMKGTFTVN